MGLGTLASSFLWTISHLGQRVNCPAPDRTTPVDSWTVEEILFKGQKIEARPLAESAGFAVLNAGTQTFAMSAPEISTVAIDSVYFLTGMVTLWSTKMKIAPRIRRDDLVSDCLAVSVLLHSDGLPDDRTTLGTGPSVAAHVTNPAQVDQLRTSSTDG